MAQSINRIRLEFKERINNDSTIKIIVLIESDWNLKTEYRTYQTMDALY